MPIRPRLPGRSPGRPNADPGLRAATIGHDIRNLLTAADLAVAMATATLDGDHPARSDLDQALIVIDRAARLAVRLCQPSILPAGEALRPDGPGCDVSAVVRSVEPILHRLVRGDGELVVDVPDRVGRVRLDAAALESLVVNLVVNARDAQPMGGRIDLVVSALDEPVTGRPLVRLAVADRGAGIDPLIRDRMFLPRQTTKPDGSGLGLAIVAEVVGSVDGTVVAQDRRSGGTRFVVDLPRIVVARSAGHPTGDAASTPPAPTVIRSVPTPCFEGEP
jgi:signal transduction histidine kinase